MYSYAGRLFSAPLTICDNNILYDTQGNFSNSSCQREYGKYDSGESHLESTTDKNSMWTITDFSSTLAENGYKSISLGFSQPIMEERLNVFIEAFEVTTVSCVKGEHIENTQDGVDISITSGVLLLLVSNVREQRNCCSSLLSDYAFRPILCVIPSKTKGLNEETETRTKGLNEETEANGPFNAVDALKVALSSGWEQFNEKGLKQTCNVSGQLRKKPRRFQNHQNVETEHTPSKVRHIREMSDQISACMEANKQSVHFLTELEAAIWRFSALVNVLHTAHGKPSSTPGSHSQGRGSPFSAVLRTDVAIVHTCPLTGIRRSSSSSSSQAKTDHSPDLGSPDSSVYNKSHHHHTSSSSSSSSSTSEYSVEIELSTSSSLVVRALDGLMVNVVMAPVDGWVVDTVQPDLRTSAFRLQFTCQHHGIGVARDGTHPGDRSGGAATRSGLRAVSESEGSDGLDFYSAKILFPVQLQRLCQQKVTVSAELPHKYYLPAESFKLAHGAVVVVTEVVLSLEEIVSVFSARHHGANIRYNLTW